MCWRQLQIFSVFHDSRTVGEVVQDLLEQPVANTELHLELSQHEVLLGWTVLELVHDKCFLKGVPGEVNGCGGIGTQERMVGRRPGQRSDLTAVLPRLHGPYGASLASQSWPDFKGVHMNQLNATSTTPEQDAAELAAYLASPPWKGYVGTLEVSD